MVIFKCIFQKINLGNLRKYSAMELGGKPVVNLFKHSVIIFVKHDIGAMFIYLFTYLFIYSFIYLFI